MLQDMRDRMTGPLVWGIIGFLCLVFAVWGIGADSFFGGGADPTLVKVGGVKITQNQFQQAYNRSYQQTLQMMGDNFDPSQIDQTRFRAGVLDNLIERTVLQQYANQAGYVAGDGAVYNYLSQIPAFQDDGRFSPDAYRAALQRSGTQPDQFEGRVREALRVQQLRDGVLATGFVVPKQALATWAVTHETRDVSKVIFSPSNYTKDVSVSTDQVQTYYDAHKADYITPQRVKLAYIELSQSTLPPAAKPDADVLKAIYEVQKTHRFTTPGQREASHILIRFNGDAAKAYTKAKKVAAELAAGGDFATLAKKYSDDPGSRAKGGKLGWLSAGMTAPTFNQALFGLAKPGAVSAPVKTKFGWDIIRLDAERPSKVQPFSDQAVQAKLLETYRSRAAAKQFESDSTQLANLVFENPTSLEPAAKKLGLKVKKTGWLTHKGGVGIAAHKTVIDAAFSQSVVKDGENSKPITIGSADQVVIRKLDEQPERQLSFDQAKQRIHDKLVKQAAATQAQAAAKALAASVRGGESLTSAAGKVGVKVDKIKALKRDDTQQDKALLNASFRLPKLAGDDAKTTAPSVGVTQLGNGDYAVLVLDAVHRPQPKAGSTELASAAQGYSQALAGGEFDAYRQTMRKAISVKREKTPDSEQRNALQD